MFNDGKYLGSVAGSVIQVTRRKDFDNSSRIVDNFEVRKRPQLFCIRYQVHSETDRCPTSHVWTRLDQSKMRVMGILTFLPLERRLIKQTNIQSNNDGTVVEFSIAPLFETSRVRELYTMKFDTYKKTCV